MLNKTSKWISFIVMTIIVASMAMPTLAQDAPTVTGINLAAVRSGPGLDYLSIGSLPEDGVLTVTGRNAFDANRECVTPFEATTDMWLRVDLQGIEGWIARCAVMFKGDVAALAIAEPINPTTEFIGEYVCNCDTFSDDILGEAPENKHIVAFSRYTRLYVHNAPVLNSSERSLTDTEQLYVTGRSADGYWVEVQYSREYLNVDPEHTAAPTKHTGWVARYLVLLPSDWQEQVPVK